MGRRSKEVILATGFGLDRMKIYIFIVLIFVASIAIWLNNSFLDRSYKLEVLVPIALLKDPPQDYPKENTIVGHVFPHESVKVVRMRYGKDFRAWRIKGDKGQVGWIVENSYNLKVSE